VFSARIDNVLTGKIINDLMNVVARCATRNAYVKRRITMITMHPGEYIRTVYLEPLGLSVSGLAQKLDVSKSALSRVVACKADISAPMAVRLGLALGRSAESWMKMQSAFSLEKAREEVDPLSITPVVVGLSEGRAIARWRSPRYDAFARSLKSRSKFSKQ
jgi:addiction module HigA family antidote